MSIIIFMFFDKMHWFEISNHHNLQKSIKNSIDLRWHRNPNKPITF